MLRVNPEKLGGGDFGARGAVLFYDWLKDSVASNQPYDKFVKELITARGSTFQVGPANYWRVETEPNGRAETTAQIFLGIRLTCARCHKHPFDRWTTDDYWNFAAFSGKVGVQSGEIYNEQVVYYNPQGQVVNQSVTGNRGTVAIPTFLGGRSVERNYQGDLLQLLADWITAPENPFFAKSTVNRFWSHFFNRGLVHPVDDMRQTTPATVEGLLEALAQEFIKSGYDVKHIIRLMLNSYAYQLSSITNETNKLDDRFFSHYYPKLMPAQVFLDAINQVTGSKDKFGRYPLETKATEVPLPVGSYFLDTFGRSHREFLADLEPNLEPTLTQALHLINSSYINRKISDPNGTIAQLLKAKVSEVEALERLYLVAFCRKLTTEELEIGKAYMAKAPSKKEAYEDLLWALITSREFMFIK